KSSALFTGTSAAQAALDSSARFFASATVVVLAPADDQAAQLRASSVALALGAPVLLTGAQDEEVAGEIERLEAGTVMPVGPVDLGDFDLSEMNVQPLGEDFGEVQDLLGNDLEEDLSTADPPQEKPARHLAELEPGTILSPGETDGSGTSSGAQRRGHKHALLNGEGVQGLHVLFDGQAYQTPAVANARAAGASVALVPGDPRASAEAVSDLGEGEAVVGYGTHYGDAESFGWQVATAATGTQLPGGSQLVFDHTRYVALYGHPGTPPPAPARGAPREVPPPLRSRRGLRQRDRPRPRAPPRGAPALAAVGPAPPGVPALAAVVTGRDGHDHLQGGHHGLLGQIGV